MGTLVAKHYPAKPFLELADHTYVECSNGRFGWSCWGGKDGGQALRHGTGSTIRANAIATPNERAGITCYLINGVCHQAANRILFPAKILVKGAKGYCVSEAMFGPYGRPRGPMGLCVAPFEKHPKKSGDLKECKDQPKADDSLIMSKVASFSPNNSPSNSGDIRYINKVTKLYDRIDKEVPSIMGFKRPQEMLDQLYKFQLDIFSEMINYRIAPDFSESTSGQSLKSQREQTELRTYERENAFVHGDLDTEEFVQCINDDTKAFQDEVANILSEEKYQALLDITRDERIVLGDPEIAVRVYK